MFEFWIFWGLVFCQSCEFCTILKEEEEEEQEEEKIEVEVRGTREHDFTERQDIGTGPVQEKNN